MAWQGAETCLLDFPAGCADGRHWAGRAEAALRGGYNLLFRQFVGLGMDDPVWDHSTFSNNRERLLDTAGIAWVESDMIAGSVTS